MATKVEKRSDRRKERDEELIATDKKVERYEESRKSLKESSQKWLLFAISILLIWFIFAVGG